MKQQQYPQQWGNLAQKDKNNKLVLGILIIGIGLLILARKTGLILPYFHTGSIVMIAIGIYLGYKHRFHHFGAWALIILGIVLVVPKFYILGVWSAHLVGPLLLILLGVWVIMKPRKIHTGRCERYYDNTLSDDTLDLNTSFGERNFTLTSKNFSGGTVHTSFGSNTIYMLGVDSLQAMHIDLKVSFGSVTLILPNDWDVQFAVANSFGSVEDNRVLYLNTTGMERKKLVINGSCSFGSVTVKSS